VHSERIAFDVAEYDAMILEYLSIECKQVVPDNRGCFEPILEKWELIRPNKCSMRSTVYRIRKVSTIVKPSQTPANHPTGTHRALRTRVNTYCLRVETERSWVVLEYHQ